MLTLEFILSVLMPQCGNDFSWSGAFTNSDRPSGGIRKGGRVRTGMRLWMHEAQQGICPTCGDALPDADRCDLAHVLGSGSMRKGFVPGNIYLSHPSCNVEVARTVPNGGYVTTLTPGDFSRPDLVQTVWPVSTVGAFIYFDPAFEGTRKV
jgi:hypothetical protein